MTPAQRNIVGRCRKPHGVRGELKITSYTDPVEKILEYTPWHIPNGEVLEVVSSRIVTGGLLVKIKNKDRIEDVEHLRNVDLYTLTPFVSSEEEGYYWKDLIGMDVYDAKGIHLGTVDGLHKAFPCNLLIFIKNDRTFYVPVHFDNAIDTIDLDKRTIRLYWHAEDFND